MFRGLVARGVLVETADSHYYLDPEAADAFVAFRRRSIFAVLMIAVVIVAIILLTR